MIGKVWSFLKRVTVGETLKKIGTVHGEYGATTGVDIRRGSDGRALVTVHLSSNFTVEINHRTTTYVYLDDTSAEKLANDLLRAVRERKVMPENR